MEKRLKLSPTHGVNPSISKCFFCGGGKEDIVLCGKLPKDAEAPFRTLVDYEPCEKCRERFGKNVVLIAVANEPTLEGQPPIQGGLYPTGAYMVVDEAAVNRIYEKDAAKTVMEAGRCLVDQKGLVCMQHLLEKT